MKVTKATVHKRHRQAHRHEFLPWEKLKVRAGGREEELRGRFGACDPPVLEGFTSPEATQIYRELPGPLSICPETGTARYPPGCHCPGMQAQGSCPRVKWMAPQLREQLMYLQAVTATGPPPTSTTKCFSQT